MAYIEFHEQLRDHIKIRRLTQLLKVPYPTALGLMSCLWAWAVGHAWDGDLAEFEDEEIAYGARLSDLDGIDAHDFVKALVSSGLLEEDKKIHDWDSHGVRLINSARSRLKKHRDSTKKPKDQAPAPKKVPGSRESQPTRYVTESDEHKEMVKKLAESKDASGKPRVAK